MADIDSSDVCGTYSWWRKKTFAAWNWRRTSLSILASVENKILSCMNIKPESRYVSLSNGKKRIWTVALNTNASTTKTPLVLLHGMGSGVAIWVLNLESIAQDRPVYAIDLLGFGRSSRIRFASDAEQAEAQFVDSIEEWRHSVGVERMILLGHSLGGYLAASYALKHADRVNHLILVDPWGFQERPPNFDQRSVPLGVRFERSIMARFNPFSTLRLAGPWGPSLVAKFRTNLVKKYSLLFDDNRIADYLYHCNAQKPSGEIAFKTLSKPIGWAKRPMLPRICDAPASLSMTFIHGAKSWVDCGIGKEVKYRRSASYVDFKVVQDACHHVYADAPDEFNRYVRDACSLADVTSRTHQKYSVNSSITSPASYSRGVNSASTTSGSGEIADGETALAAT